MRDAAGLVEVLLGRGQGVRRGCVVGLVLAARARRQRSADAGRAATASGGQRRGGAGRCSTASASHAVRPASRPATGPAHGDDRLAAGHARAVAPAGRPRAGRPARRWRRPPGPGAGPAQAKTRVSSPLRNRWQRTPPVARPLAGYSANGVTLTAPGSVPGSAVRRAGRGDHDRVGVRVERAEPDDRARRRRAGCRRCRRPSGPAGGPPPAAKCSSWASEVMKHELLVAGAQLDARRRPRRRPRAGSPPSRRGCRAPRG